MQVSLSREGGRGLSPGTSGHNGPEAQRGPKVRGCNPNKMGRNYGNGLSDKIGTKGALDSKNDVSQGLDTSYMGIPRVNSNLSKPRKRHLLTAGSQWAKQEEPDRFGLEEAMGH